MKIVSLTFFVFLMINLTIAQERGLKRITYHFVPSEWKLFEFYPNPFSPVYNTELCVPESAKIDVKIFREKNHSKDGLIRQHVNKNNYIFSPAIYKLDWSFAEDSLDLPVIDGYYKIMVNAYSTLNEDLVFTDSIKTIVLGGWKDLGVLIEEEDWFIFDSTRINENLEIESFTHVNVPSPRIMIPSVRYRNSIKNITPAQLAIRFVLDNDFDKTSRPMVYLYSGIKDDNSIYGIRPTKKLGYLWQNDFSKIFNNNEFEYLIINYSGYDISALNLKKVFSSYINEK